MQPPPFPEGRSCPERTDLAPIRSANLISFFRAEPGKGHALDCLGTRLQSWLAPLALILLLIPSVASAQQAPVEHLTPVLPLLPGQPTEVTAECFSGQVFITWRENLALKGESYRVYRSTKRITARTLGGAQFLYEVPEGSSTFWSEYVPCGTGCADSADTWEPRFSATMPIPTGAADQGVPAAFDQGMLVWTVGPEDIIGGAFQYYYAVTTVTASGDENRLLFSGLNRARTQLETVDAPRPIKLKESVTGSGVIQHVYVQYMDLRTWNPTLQAPNAVHQDYGQDLSDPSIANAISYAFSYVVLEPPSAPAGPLPVILKLHHYLRDIVSGKKFSSAVSNNQVESYFDYPAIEIRPIDVGSTWWFGFADKSFDYRTYPDRCAAIDDMAISKPAIRNYTEARVLRMLYDIGRDTDYWAGRIDTERTYVVGHSMGGGGSLAMAIRFPEIFAAAYATAPVTNFYRLVDADAPCDFSDPNFINCPRGLQAELAFDVAAKWGPPGAGSDPFQHVYPGECEFNNPREHEQPIVIDGPVGWTTHLQEYDGAHVYDWQDHFRNIRLNPAGSIAPINVRHSSSDPIVNWKFQGRPLYSRLDNANLAWSGLVDDFISHLNPYWFLGLSPNYADIPNQGPFFGLTAVLSETIPSFKLNSDRGGWIFPVPAPGIYFYNAQLVAGIGLGDAFEWSSSWFPWDKSPVDKPKQWSMSVRTVDGSPQIVEISPRRLQAFRVYPGQVYNWTSAQIDGKKVECGCVMADARGVISIPDLLISGAGRRITIRPGIDPNCLPCIEEPGPKLPTFPHPKFPNEAVLTQPIQPLF